MKYLLDTHTVLWSLFNPERLSGKIYNLLITVENEVYVSVVSFHKLPRLHKDPFDRMLIWQTILRKMTLVSGNKEFKKKDCTFTLWL